MTTLLSDPRVTRIPIHDIGHPLVDLASYGIECAHRGDGPPPGRLVREGLASRLQAADRALTRGHRFLVAEGFRSAADQLAIIDGYTRALRLEYPRLHDDEIRRLSSRFVAPIEVAPHVAGAAVDLTILGPDGRQLDMGTPIDATPEDSADACFFDAAAIRRVAKDNRRMLARVLAEAGLVNYPTEWWHWSYGDRYWAYVRGAEHAVYGPVVPEDEASDSGTGHLETAR
jgi:D-alanyl-D-alanine dipeptidase